MRTVEHFINGSSVADGGRTSDIWNPSDARLHFAVGRVPDVARAAAVGDAAAIDEMLDRAHGKSL